jgi:hypothetical protein
MIRNEKCYICYWLNQVCQDNSVGEKIVFSINGKEKINDHMPITLI